MYIYTIYKEEDSGTRSKIDCVVCTSEITLTDLNEKASARLNELRSMTDKPESITMERRLLPLI